MALVILVALRFAALLVSLHGLPANVTGHYVANDALRYFQIAETSGTPYRDFPVEVPPVELAELRLLSAPDPRAMAVKIAWVQFMLDVIVTGALVLGWGERTALAYLVLSSPLIPFLYYRIDLLSVALATLALALARKGRETEGGALLAIAILTKLWPLVLLPAFLVDKRRRALVAAVVPLAVGIAAWVAWAGLQGPREVLTFRGSHGWQIESVVGALVVIASSSPIVFEGGALRVGLATMRARAALTLSAAASVLGCWALARRRRPRVEGLTEMTVVALILILSPILSWQYVSWLLPWAAIAAAEGEWALGGMTFAASALTCWMIFESLPLSVRSGTAEVVVSARNAVLVGIAVLGIVRIAIRKGDRSAEGATEQTPVSSPITATLE